MLLSSKGGDVEFTHDTLMGAILIAAAVLTFLFTRSQTSTLKLLALLGALGTLVIGVLLFFGIA